MTFSSGKTTCLCRTRHRGVFSRRGCFQTKSQDTRPFFFFLWSRNPNKYSAVVSKAKNRSIKVLFVVYIHDSASFVWRISIIKYCIKHSCHISTSLVPAARWCYFFYRDALVAAPFIGGHQSLFVKVQKGSWQLCQLPLQDGAGIYATAQTAEKCHVVEPICRRAGVFLGFFLHKLIITASDEEKRRVEKGGNYHLKARS